MKKLIPKLLSIAASLLAIQTQAQSDYLITPKGDSVRCFIKKPLLDFYRYKTDSAKGENTKITTDIAKRFFILKDSILMVSITDTWSKRPRFLTALEYGKLKLYEEIVPSGRSYITDWYISTGTDSIAPLKTSGLAWVGAGSKQERKDRFAQLIKDNKAVYDLYIKDDDFGFNEIKKLVRYYNTGALPPVKKEQTDNTQDN